MIKAILFDADGVMLKKQGVWFSLRYAKERGVPPEKIEAFFKGAFRDVQTGRGDLLQELAPHLKGWKWDGTIEEFVRAWQEGDTVVDQEMVELVRRLRGNGIRCYLATDQDSYRARYISETLGFGVLFDDCFFSYEIGHRKCEKEFFEIILRRLDLPAEKVAYWDDDQENVTIALSLGIQARFFTGIKELEKEL